MFTDNCMVACVIFYAEKLPWQYTGFGVTVKLSVFFFTASLQLKDLHSEVKERRCVRVRRDVAGLCSIWTEMKEWKKKTRSEKNVQRRPVGSVCILTSEFHQLCVQWISAPDWQLMALNSFSFQWLPVLSQLCGHPESSAVETHAFYFLLDARSRRSNSAQVGSW